MSDAVRRRLKEYAFYFLVWTLLGLFFCSEALTQRVFSQDPTQWWHYVVSRLTGVYIWALLRDNAHGMYLIHYAFVSWLQYLLLPETVPAIAKGLFVFGGTVALSWGTTALLRRIPVVRRTI
ncbi:MAG: hypothetical protein M3Y72_24590 [Acidobacteriota bacterium]|nr:hypothetical protein [Acidobacteriota bacterium]